MVMFLFVGLIGIWIDGCQTQEQEVERLIGELGHHDRDVRGVAAEALEQIGTPEALKAVEEYQSRQ